MVTLKTDVYTSLVNFLLYRAYVDCGVEKGVRERLRDQ